MSLLVHHSVFLFLLGFASYITTTPPPGVEPRPTEARVVDTATGELMITEGDEVMIDAEVEGKNVGREEEARNRPEEARESGIARAVIASETRPKPVEELLEREIGGKVFKLGRSLEGETQDQIARVIERHLDAFCMVCLRHAGNRSQFLVSSPNDGSSGQTSATEKKKVQ